MFFKRSELSQGKAHLKALGEGGSPLGTHGASPVSGRGGVREAGKTQLLGFMKTPLLRGGWGGGLGVDSCEVLKE